MKRAVRVAERPFPRLLAGMSLSGMLLLGCRDEGPRLELRHNPSGQGTKVATFGKDSITAEEVEQRLREMPPYLRSRYQSPEQKKTFVEDMSRFELLAQEAARRRMYERPEVVAMAKQVMVQKLLDEELTEKKDSVTDEEVQAYYDAHKADFVKPEMVRVAHVFLKAPQGTPERTKRKAEAMGVLSAVKKLAPSDSAGFSKIVQAKSDEPRTKSLNGDLRFLTLDAMAAQYDPGVAEAASQLTTPGQVSGLVEAKDGFHVLRLLGRQAAVNQSPADARAQIVTRILSERRAKKFHALLDTLAQKSKLHVDVTALEKVKVDPSAPTVPAKGPPPQVIPAPALPAGAAASTAAPQARPSAHR